MAYKYLPYHALVCKLILARAVLLYTLVYACLTMLVEDHDVVALAVNCGEAYTTTNVYCGRSVVLFLTSVIERKTLGRHCHPNV